MPKIAFYNRVLFLLKVKIRHFFGLDLPLRVIELNFVLKQTSKKAKKISFNKKQILEEFDVLEAQTSAIFQKTIRDIETLNRTDIFVFMRLNLTRMYLYRIYPTLVRVMNSQRGTGRLPDDSVRRDELEKAIRAIEELLMSFQHCFSALYHLPNWQYVFIGKEISICAIRIFELIELQQECRALRYRPLPASSWACLNKVYHVMGVYESVERDLPLIKTRMDKQTAETDRATLNDMFILIQLMSYFDSMNFPTQYYSYIKSYVRDHSFHLAFLSIKEPSIKESSIKEPTSLDSVRHKTLDKETLDKDTLFIGHDQRTPPQAVSNLIAEQLPGWGLNVLPLRIDILKSYLNVMVAAEKNQLATAKTPFFRKLNERDRLIFILLLNANLKLPRKYEYSSAKLYNMILHVGFRDCHSIKSDEYNEENRRKTLADTFDARKKFIAQKEDGPIAENSWYVLSDDNQFLVLQANETPTTVPLAIGKIAIFDFPDEPSLSGIGIVSRIERKPSDQFIVHLRKLARHAETAAFMDLKADEAETKSHKLPSLLLLVANRWHVMLVNQIEYVKGKQVQLERKKITIPCQLGKWIICTTEFSIYELVGDSIDALRPSNIQSKIA